MSLSRSVRRSPAPPFGPSALPAAACLHADQLGAWHPDVAGGDPLARRTVGIHLRPVGQAVLGFLAARDVLRPRRGQIDLAAQRLANELAMALVADRVG